jgi:2-polyprenyl-3-methyl-5-hydroxy-6-metoxy-1,4-benzoquinol methylase
MAHTLLLSAATDEATHAPEFRYLISWVELQAHRVLGEIVAVEEAGTELEAMLGPADRILVLAHERILITARSLAALRDALDAGAEAAAPRLLAEVPEAAGCPVHTLRGFERLEEALLSTAAQSAASGAPEPLPPVALYTREGLERLLAGRSPAELVRADLELPEGFRIARTGLYHEFIDYYGEVRSDVLPHLPAGARRVLEVGCGRGATGELVRRELGARVTGVELNPVVAREAAARLDRVIAGDIDDPAVAVQLAEEGPYDLVLALELFEHLAWPEDFLRHCRELLRPGGVILLSTPNVGHYSVVEDLLAGRWDYLPIGLLCYTHLRFFTRRTLEDWLGRLGFEHFELTHQETEESPHLEALAQAVEVDRPSLRTQGFWVRIEV